MRKESGLYWKALRESLGPVWATVATGLSGLGVLDTIKTSFWPQIVIPVFKVGPDMISIFTYLSLITMLGACLHRSVKKEREFKDEIDVLKSPSPHYTETLRHLEGWERLIGTCLKEIHQLATESSKTTDRGREAEINNSAIEKVRSYLAKRERINMALAAIYKERVALPLWPSSEPDETGTGYIIIFPVVEIANDLMRINELKQNISPFLLNDFNANDLAAHGVE